jgi:O-antigen/teichoic acid export membrane protein/glycosyltransferase involved in cell wall biosynthesis
MSQPLESTKGGSSILHNTLWLAWSGAINIANSVVIWMALARWRNTAEVGQFATVMSLQTIFMTVCGLGLTPYLTNQLARQTERRRIVGSATLLITCWSALCVLLMIAAGYYFNAGATGRLAAYILSLSIIPTGLISIGEAIFTACGQGRVIALATTTENLLRTVIPLLLLYRGHSLPVVCLSFVLVRLAACAVYVLTARQKFGAMVRPEWRLVREIATVAPTFVGVSLLAALHWQMGTILASKLGGEAAAADFGVASRFLMPVMVLLSSYMSVIQPAASRLAQRSQAELGDFLARCLRLVIALALPLAVGGLTLGINLLVLLFGEKYAGAALALCFLAAGIVPFSIVMVAARGLVATGRQRIDLLANLVAVVINFAANLLLIPRYGAAGAAAAQLLSLTAMAVVAVYVGARPLFSLHIWQAIWICRWPLAAMLNVIVLTYTQGFLWTLTLGGATYLIGLALIWEQLRPSRSTLNEGNQAATRALPRVLMVGAHPTRTLGGISTLINDILHSPLTREFAFKHIVSQMDECGKLGKLLLAGAALLRFIWALCSWRPNVVYIHVGGNTSLYRKTLFIALAGLAGWRVITHFHAGNFAPYFAAQTKLGQQLILRGLGLSTKFIAVSQEMATWLGELWPQAEVTVIPNGVRTELFACQRVYEAPTPRLLFVGKMGFLKGEADLLLALQSLKRGSSANSVGADQFLCPGSKLSTTTRADTQVCPYVETTQPPAFRLDLVGQLSGEINELIHTANLASHIDQLGPVALTRRVEYFKRADIFILPSYAEGLPIAVLEAMAAGLPIITTPVGGIPELIEDGVEGMLVQPGDCQALAEAVARLLGDAELRRQLGERAQRRASRFDLAQVLAQLGAELRQETVPATLQPVSLTGKGSN